MKKVFVLLLAVVVSLALVGCSSDPLVNEAKDYYVTGNWNGWTTDPDTGLMEAIAKNDDRVSSIKGDLKDVEFLYLAEITLPSEGAGWDVTYTIDDVETVFDGNLTVKFIRTAADDQDLLDWWCPSPESGELGNLTPDTLFMPTYVDPATVDATPDGDWNSNPVAYEAGTYYAVFAEFEDGSRACGLIEVPAE